MATPYGQFTSDQPIVLTDDFPPPGVPEFDLDHRTHLRFTLNPGEMASRVEVKVGFRRTQEPPRPDRICVDFRSAPVGPGPNPRVDHGASFVVRDQAGNPLANTYTDEWATATTPVIGLFCGFGVDIQLTAPAQVVEITLTHAGTPATVEAFNSNGTTAGVQTMTTNARQPQTLKFAGSGIQRLRVVAPEDETLLNELCFGTVAKAGNQVTVSALLGTTVVAQTVLAGAAGQVVTASLQFDAISAIQLSAGAAALVSFCFVPVASDALTGWSVVPYFRSPLGLPVLHPDYPPARGAQVNVAAAQAMALARILYGPAPSWAAGFPDLHGELIALVTGGPGSTPMADRMTAVTGMATPPDPTRPPPTMKAQHPLDLVLLGSLNPAVAQMLGLCWVDRAVDPAAIYDYLVVADHTGVGKLDSATVLQEIQQNGFRHLDGWIVANQRLGPAPALLAPTEVRSYALPGLTAPAPAGGLSDETNTAGIRWRLQPSSGGLAPGEPIAYHVWRAGLGDGTNPAAPTTYDLVTTGGPVLAAQVAFAHGTTPQYPSDWPPFPLDYIDAGLADGWYSYEVSGVDIFGRHTPNSGGAAWYQWVPVPDPRPWYYQNPPGDLVIHPFAVRLRDTVAPPPPAGIEAYALDPLDPLLEKDAAHNNWFATLSAGEKTSLTGLRVRWLWPESLHRQAPRVREFRIYYQPGQLNVLLGRTVSVTPSTAGDTSSVVTDISNSHPPGAYVGTWLRIGNRAYPIVASSGLGALYLTVNNIGPAHDQLPEANRPCSISIPASYPGFTDYARATNWQDRYYVVDYNQHVTVTTDSAGKPLRAYEVFIPDASDTVRTGLPLAANLAEPIAYAQISVSSADDRSYVADDVKWSIGHWGSRYGREGDVGAPATILVVLRSKPPAPVPPADAPSVLATPADYHGHSFYTYRWPASANLNAHVFRALDETLFKDDWAKRPRAALQATDLQYFPSETIDTRWNPAKRQQVATELNQLNTFAHDTAGTAQALAYYRALSNDGLRVLAGLDGNEAAFSQLTIEALDPHDPATANRVGPDNPPSYTIDPALRIYIDTLDGRGSNRYFYRAAYVNGAHSLGPLGLSSPPVGLPKVVPPRTPVITRVLGGDRKITISWASNREFDLAEYRVYRAASDGAARDLRLMTLAHTETVAAGLPSTRPAVVTWTDTPVQGLVSFWYVLVAVDNSGNISAPTAPVAARATDDALPALPPLNIAWTSSAPWKAEAVWTSSDESQLERKPLVGFIWSSATQWLPPGQHTIDDSVDSSASWSYRLRVRKASGATALGASVTLGHK